MNLFFYVLLLISVIFLIFCVVMFFKEMIFVRHLFLKRLETGEITLRNKIAFYLSIVICIVHILMYIHMTVCFLLMFTF